MSFSLYAMPTASFVKVYECGLDRLTLLVGIAAFSSNGFDRKGGIVVTGILIDILEILVPATATFLAAIIAKKSLILPEESKTARMIFDNVYSKIFVLLEHHLFQKVTLQEVRELGQKINSILEENPGYYYPSLKVYCERMIHANHKNYQEHFDTFCETFDKQYDICCKKIGIPLRSAAYRLNRKHYKGEFGFWITLFSLPGFGLQLAFYITLLVIFYYLSKFS